MFFLIDIKQLSSLNKLLFLAGKLFVSQFCLFSSELALETETRQKKNSWKDFVFLQFVCAAYLELSAPGRLFFFAVFLCVCKKDFWEM